jgi:hypothetical protein
MAAAKKKKVTKKRAPKLCVVCREQPQNAGYSHICEECDMSYAVALVDKVGTIEWAAARARDIAVAKIIEAAEKVGG